MCLVLLVPFEWNPTEESCETEPSHGHIILRAALQAVTAHLPFLKSAIVGYAMTWAGARSAKVGYTTP